MTLLSVSGEPYGMIHVQATNQGHRSVGSTNILETNGRADEHDRSHHVPR